MSKRTLVSRRKREERILRKFFFTPQRVLLGRDIDVTELPPMSDRLLSLPSDPYRRSFDHYPPNPYRS